MNTVRKILVPIDFSEDSANGLKYAVSLAQKTDAELVVMHVTPKKRGRCLLGFTGRDGRLSYAECSGWYACRSINA
jgi:Universal stress protein family